MHSPEKWTTCCITRKNIHDLKKICSHAIWNLIYIANESKKRAHYIWKLCTHHFDRCQNCHLSFIHQMLFSVKFTSQMAYGDRSELFTYLKLCIILCSNIIFISRFKCVVHHFKLFAVEWRYSFAVEWRFTKPKSKKKITRFANVSIEYMVPRARMVFNENFLFSWFESSWSVKSSFYRTEQYWWTESRLLY